MWTQSYTPINELDMSHITPQPVTVSPAASACQDVRTARDSETILPQKNNIQIWVHFLLLFLCSGALNVV